MKPKSNRAPFAPRPFFLSSKEVIARVHALLDNLPVDPVRPLQLVVREAPKVRKLDQQALMWAGPLADIAAQAWVCGQQYADTTWHEHFKRLYLPEQYDPEFCLEGYIKWALTPGGDKVLTGSTTQLTVKGMSEYMEQVYRDGAEMGVEFRASPNEGA